MKKKVKKKTSEDEKDKEYLVEMLYSLISDNTQPANKSNRESGATPKSGDEDLPKPVAAYPEPKKEQFSVLVTPGVLEDLPSKSAFDNLLGASSDVTVEALEDTLDTSELEWEFGDISDGNNVRVDSEHGHSLDDKVLKLDDGEANTKKTSASQKSINVSMLKGDEGLDDFITVLVVELGRLRGALSRFGEFSEDCFNRSSSQTIKTGVRRGE